MPSTQRSSSRSIISLTRSCWTVLISRFSWFMTGGHAWILIIAFSALADRRRALKALGVLPAFYLATYSVEFPIKRYFRRRRPFISIVRAIVVGRKPGSYSFPSGQSAAAFAGATVLQTCYPRAPWALFAVAALVAFSRVYLCTLPTKTRRLTRSGRVSEANRSNDVSS